jgi:PmbA protein
MNQQERIKLCEWVIDFALKQGANQVAISLVNTRLIEIEYRDKKLEKLKESTRNLCNLSVYVGQRYSLQTTSDLRKDTLKNFIKESITATKYLDRDEFRSLPESRYYPEDTRIDLKTCDPAYNNIQSKERIKFAAEIESSAGGLNDNIISSTAYYNDRYTQAVKMHSTGFTGEISSTSYGAGAEVTVKDRQEGRPEDWFFAHTRFYQDLPSPDYLGTQAANRALRKIGQEKITSGKYDMIVENRAGSRLISMLQRPLLAKYLQQKNSYLENMLNKSISSDKLTIIDDPAIEKGLASRLFDSECLAARKRMIIEKGVLRNYYIDNYYGKKLEMEPTSGSTSNLVFVHGDKSPEVLIKELERGILVTGFIGGNSNTTTGDFSFGISGLLIEKGEIVKPVNEMNISGNAKEFWKRLLATGNDPYPYSSWYVPSMLFEKVHFSGL